jgi:M6 family metalloprotease-like protein
MMSPLDGEILARRRGSNALGALRRTQRWSHSGRAWIATCLLVTACGGDVTGPGETDDQTVAAIRIIPSILGVELGAHHKARAEALNAAGDVLDGRQIRWSIDGESVATVTVDGDLHARTAGRATLEATSEGVVATAQVDVVTDGSADIAACKPLGLGPESYQRPPSAAETPTGELRAIMLFADFPDAPGSEPTQPLYDMGVPRAKEWFAEVSGGRFALVVDQVPGWFRAPDESASYDASTYDGHRRYIQDVADVADPTVDFSPYQAIFVVASDRSRQSGSFANPGFDFQLDGVQIRSGVTFGTDLRIQDPLHYAGHLVVHETGHLLGLPDLYLYGASSFATAHQSAGMWDVMSWLGTGAHYLAWHKWKLGWIDEERVDCLYAASVERTLVPFDADTGLQTLIVRTPLPTMHVIEVRRARGFDGNICEEGVLVYSVDLNAPGGSEPVRVLSARPDRDAMLAGRAECGPLYESTFGVGGDRVSELYVADAGLGVTVLEDLGDGYRVRVNLY